MEEFETKIFAYIMGMASLSYGFKLLILVAVFKPQVFKTVFEWSKYLYNTPKLEKLRTLIVYTVTRHKYSVNDLDASIQFNSIIDGQRLLYNAMESNWCPYHNLISAGFRNYSCRVESVRELRFSWAHTMQSMPLAPYEKIIQRFQEESVQIIDVDDEMNDYNSTVILNLKNLNAKRLIIIPVCIPVKEAYPGFTYSLRRVIDGVDSYIAGVISATLDEESKLIPKHDIQIQGKNLIAQVISMYIKNPKCIVK